MVHINLMALPYQEKALKIKDLTGLSMKKYRFEYFASCPSGLEELLSQEIIALGAKSTKIVRRGVQFESFHEIALKIVLYTRLASRVYKYLFTFEVLNEKDYYLEATDVKWKGLMEVNQTFRLITIFGDLPPEREDFRNSQFANLKLKDAIVDFFRHYEGERPSVERDNPDVAMLAMVERGEEKPFKVTLMLDLSGHPLHQRGYRVELVEAPVKENVAAAMLKLVNWDPTTEGLLDAMSGSGTIAIEAALIAADIPPSYLMVEHYLKNPDFKMWTFLNYPWLTKDTFLQENFKKLLEEITLATERGLKKLETMNIMASDISDRSLYATKDNLRKARLNGLVKVKQQDALESRPVSEKTLFICNPPYGERLGSGEEERLKALYSGLGDHWKHEFKGHRAAIFTGNLEMLKAVGLRTSKRHILFNGDIECRLAEYTMY
jgi:23S rRNA G2445 N2-methylase RlmL